MHYWGDEWFQKNGQDLNSAISEIEKTCRRYGGIKIFGKEKYGTYRDEYLRLWDGSLHYILYSSYVRIENKFIYWTLDPILRVIFKYTGILKLVNWYQSQIYNYAIQKVCKKYPDIVDEIVSDLDGYEMVKPGWFGNISGEKIHKKHWKTI